mmetsp:Transcript_27993/g.56195  ORF Transcript_27993/g.56195 Transcript_27993/m.56195 type:complete len:171 (-) Transcript_27993:1229-1741(-)
MTYNTLSALLCCVALLFSREISAFSSSSRCSQNSITTLSRASTSLLLAQSDDTMLSRREWSKRAFASLITGAGSIATIASNPEQSNAADDIIWKTGKSPQIPGQKPKEKGDVKGTKKDPNFLRSISDCKTKCETGYGPDGLSRSASECLSSCQDICCTTYEQCTFAITPR